MLKVLLINPSSHTKYPSPPLGLLQLAACLKLDGYEVKIADMNIKFTLSNIGWSDVVGITAVTPNINSAIRVAKMIKTAYPDKVVIIGGSHATLMPYETLEAGCFDVVVAGEGESALSMLIDSMESELPIDDIPNLYCKSGEYYWETEQRKIRENINELPMPDYSLIDISKYHPHPPHGRKKPWLPMITSRGCPYSCTFCSKPVFGSKYRSLAAENVIKHIKSLKQKYSVKEITFYDDVFTLDKGRIEDLCLGIVREDIDLDWSCETRVNLVDDYLLSMMNVAGCFLIAYGIESGSPEILKNLNKGISLDQVEETIAHTREAGIQTIGYFMIGNPGETKEDIEKTIKFAIKLKLDYAQFAITIPLPGSQLYEQYIAEGHQMPSWDAFSYANMGKATIPMFNAQNLTTDDIREAINQANRRFYLRLGYMWQRGLASMKSWDDFKLLVFGAKVYLENMVGK